MNKQDLVNVVSSKTEMLKKDSEKAVNAVISAIEEALANQDRVQLVGFGTFEVKDRAEKTGRNPQTQESIIIPAHKTPSFKAGKSLKELVNK